MNESRFLRKFKECPDEKTIKIQSSNNNKENMIQTIELQNENPTFNWGKMSEK